MIRPERMPRLPVFGWSALSGAGDARSPCMMDLPNVHFSTSGRASILLALETLKLQAGDKVLLPSYHCPTMVAPAVGLDAIPVFYPITGRGSPDFDWLDALDLSGVKAMLVAHFFGLPQPLRSIKLWCSARGIALIEDCAHALFGMADGQPMGTWGDIAIGSLTKFLPVPEGGCLVVNIPGAQLPAMSPSRRGEALKAAVDMLEVGAIHGRLRGANSVIRAGLAVMRALRARKFSLPQEAESTDLEPLHPLGTDFRIDGALAHRLVASPCTWVASHLPRGRVVENRRRNYDYLHAKLKDRTGIRPLLTLDDPDCAPYVFPLWTDHPDPGYLKLRALKLPVFRWDRLWPDTPRIPNDQGTLWSHHVIQLGCHQDLSARDLDAMIQHLLRVYCQD